MFFLRKSFSCPLNESIPLSTPIEEVSFTVYDTETTGFQIAAQDRLIEIGAVQMKGPYVHDELTFQTYVNPERDIPEKIVQLTGITQEDVKGAPDSYDAISEFFQFVDHHNTAALVGHYVQFDMMVLKQELKREQLQLKRVATVDTLDLIGHLSPAWDMRDLERYAVTFGTPIYKRHSALGDSLTTAYLYSELLQQFMDRGGRTWGDLLRATEEISRQAK